MKMKMIQSIRKGRPIMFLLTAFLFLNISCSDSDDDMVSKEILTQEMLMDKMIPILQSKGEVYRKYKKVLARKAVAGEKIITITSDGVETVNVAEEGDYVVKNQTDAEEMYIMSAEKFEKRYEWLSQVDDEYSLYKPIGKVVAKEIDNTLIKQLGHGDEFKFIAPWGEEMVAKKGDYLVSPLSYEEVYRIAKKEFFETYELDLPVK
ncbi:MAG: hypothetical protein ACR2MS_00120 [Weeksellaceae bacterium]